jgi:hypothetical protein
MLAIKFKDAESFEEEWHVGEKNPIHFECIEGISMMQADGHELTHIIEQYQQGSIPVANVQIMRWCGSIAQTIVANL